LINWQILPDALRPSANEDAWDSASTWTGSIIQYKGLWHLFYTGASKSEKGLIQRVGVATSADLITWEKQGDRPVLEADPRWYELLDLQMWHDQAWRDPWVFELNGRFHAFVTARSNQGHKSGRGVIGCAWSEDLRQWHVEQPVVAPGEFSFMEVPQLVEINGFYYLIFCVGIKEYADVRRQRDGVKPATGTHYLVSERPLGPYRFLTDDFLLGDEVGSTYAGKLIQNPAGDWVLMVTRAWTGNGGFIGEIADPIPLHVRPNGELKLHYHP